MDKDSFDRLDHAIDRTVRDMTHVAADDRAVARVMARVRAARAEDGKRWLLTPRVVWCSVLALLLMAILSRHSWHRFSQHAETPRVAGNAPVESPNQPLAAREFPTPVVTAPSITQATTARVARSSVLTPSSVTNGPADASERSAAVEMPPLESDITLASIVPAPLAETPAIQVEPLITSSLQVDDIPLPSIDMPPVSPERRE
jgi:hypothetical protein